MYTKHWLKGGIRFVQQMDLSTDTAIYRDIGDNILMTVDSSGNCFDKEGNDFGRFSLNYGGDHTWYYESENREVIQTGCIELFDEAEPFVIAKLFGEQMSERQVKQSPNIRRLKLKMPIPAHIKSHYASLLREHPELLRGEPIFVYKSGMPGREKWTITNEKGTDVSWNQDRGEAFTLTDDEVNSVFQYA